MVLRAPHVRDIEHNVFLLGRRVYLHDLIPPDLPVQLAVRYPARDTSGKIPWQNLLRRSTASVPSGSSVKSWLEERVSYRPLDLAIPAQLFQRGSPHQTLLVIG